MKILIALTMIMASSFNYAAELELIDCEASLRCSDELRYLQIAYDDVTTGTSDYYNHKAVSFDVNDYTTMKDLGNSIIKKLAKESDYPNMFADPEITIATTNEFSWKAFEMALIMPLAEMEWDEGLLEPMTGGVLRSVYKVFRKEIEDYENSGYGTFETNNCAGFFIHTHHGVETHSAIVGFNCDPE